MTRCLADLHVHTALSPCADDEMTPPAIVAGALGEGLAMIAICDHNSARNAAAVQAAAGARLAVLAGMEITSVEECHVVGLFPDARAAEAAGARVAAAAARGRGGLRRSSSASSPSSTRAASCSATRARALATATPLDVAPCVDLVHRHGGLAVAAHVDRPSFGVIGQLGFFPADAGFDAVEVSRHVAAGVAGGASASPPIGLPLLRSSDAHYLADIGAGTHRARPRGAGLRRASRPLLRAEVTAGARADA